ncbi:nucleolar protein 9 [Acipenser ruthenus]|uniref:nucleolar protein 9 n=1 Tax=Acipenser ruthenus TaxID=7906 RepID=UPI00145B677E|nr:nucleolar protein 9 [Acipenser ruthenus]
MLARKKGETGTERGKKERPYNSKRKEEERGKKHGDGGMEKGRGKRLDPMSVGYFRRVSERLGEEFSSEEEKALFVSNVFSEVRGQALPLATDPTGSFALQRLLPLATPTQVCRLLKGLREEGEEEGSGFKTAACQRCGAHVIETALRQTRRLLQDTGGSGMQEDSEEGDGDAEDCGAVEDHVLGLASEVTEKLLEYSRDTHGTFVVRTLIHVLGGLETRSQEQTGRGFKKPAPKAPEFSEFEVPESFKGALECLADKLLEHVTVFLTHSTASPVFQICMQVFHRQCPELCQRLGQGMLGYLTSLNPGAGSSPLLVFLKDQTSSRLLEKMVELSQKPLFRSLYKDHFRGQLVTLALHPIANFPVQRLLAAVPNQKLFVKIFDELSEGLEAILAAGHMGVIVQLAESCVKHGERQTELLQCLLQAFHCADPPSRKLSCAPLFLTLLAHEVYYQPEKPGGDVEQSQKPLSGLVYHGSCLVQSLLRFSDNSALLRSLRSLPASDLLILASDQSGSHVMEALMTSLSDKGRDRLFKKLKGHYVQLSCSKHGSRVLDKLWSVAVLGSRRAIAEELASRESELRADQFGHHAVRNFALSHFLKRRREWEELQTAQSKKRKMFDDILD